MTTLFDKLKGRHGSAAAVIDRELDFSSSPRPSTSAGEPSPGHARHLGDTLPSENHGPSMSFQYAPGSMPLPPYRIRRGIGMGGFGEVYFAVSEAGKEVALKRVQRNLDVELRGVSHCLNLKHPNLVSLFDICRDSMDQAWVVMEYVAGPNLRQVLDDSPSGLPEAEVKRWFAGISAGVRHLHQAGLVHRDLKPGNVFDDMSVVKVGDYGLSKFISTSHRGGHTESVGTFHYMAPEIGRGQYGREIDIYALGIVLFELLTGNVPFDGESCHEIIVKHLTATPDLSAIAEPYRSTIGQCLEKDPAKRPATIDQMLKLMNLSSFAGSVTSNPVASGPVESPVAAKSQTPVMASVVGPAALALPQRTNPEPLARAIWHSCDDARRWWAALDRSPGAKIFLTIVIGFMLLLNTHWLLPLLSVLGVFYVPYYVIRNMVLHVRQQPTYAEAQRVASVSTAAKLPLSRSQIREQLRGELRAKHSLVRIAELSTSYIATTFTTIVLALVAGVIGLRSGEVTASSLAPYFWMATVVIVGAFALLGLGKLWERGEGEELTRRIALGGVGAGIGVFAFMMMQFLMMPADGLTRGIDNTALPQALYLDNGIPRASAWMAHFALLFAAIRWWKPVDPLRRRRLSLWSVAVAVVVEWLVHQVLPIPQPGGMLLVGGLSIASQMSAPWISPVTAAVTRVTNTNRRLHPSPMAGGNVT